MEYQIEMTSTVDNQKFRTRRETITVSVKQRMREDLEFEPVGDSFAIQTARQLCTSVPATKYFYKDKGDPDKEWHEKTVEHVTVIEPGVVEVLIIDPYLD